MWDAAEAGVAEGVGDAPAFGGAGAGEAAGDAEVGATDVRGTAGVIAVDGAGGVTGGPGLIGPIAASMAGGDGRAITAAMAMVIPAATVMDGAIQEPVPIMAMGTARRW